MRAEVGGTDVSGSSSLGREGAGRAADQSITWDVTPCPVKERMERTLMTGSRVG